MHDGCAEEPGCGRVFLFADSCLIPTQVMGVGRGCRKVYEVISVAAFFRQGRLARADIGWQSTVRSHSVGFFVAFFAHLFMVLPYGVGRYGDHQGTQ